MRPRRAKVLTGGYNRAIASTAMPTSSPSDESGSKMKTHRIAALLASLTLIGLANVMATEAMRTDVSPCVPSQSINAAEMQQRDAWTKDHLPSSSATSPQSLGFSFVYDGQPSEQILRTWQRTCSSKQIERGRTQTTIAWIDAKTGLELSWVGVRYADFPVVEWTIYFKNTNPKNTPILEKIQALDSQFERAPSGEFVLKYHKGDTCGPDLYQPLEQSLSPNASMTFAPNGGRASNGAFPYYNLTMPGGGVMLAVGWPGQWSATFARDAQRGLHVVAGQQRTHLSLRPGEEIRTPLIAMLFWQDVASQRAQNVWRRWMIAHNVPRTADGKLPPTIVLGNTSLEFNEMCNATEENQNHFLDRYQEERIKIDYWWMDAGWYPCKGWPQTGTWEPDLKRFPKGLRGISDHARAKGVKTLVWFEPERVAEGTWLAKNHPEWLLGNKLLDLGNPPARKWLTDHVDCVIRQQGIDLYRQDFNMDPLSFWQHADSPDRQGMTENLHVQGYLAYWDALRQRHPSLIIDSCASGGRRNDLETMRRAVPLHPTDFNYSNLTVKQAFHHSLFHWIPYFGSNTLPIQRVDTYAYRSGHAMAMVLGYDLRRKDLDYDLLRKQAEEARRVQEYYLGDYYRLTPYNRDEDGWIAWQFHRPELGEGVVQAFRRPKSDEPTKPFKLAGLDPEVSYEVTDFDSPTSKRLKGRELIEKGLPVTISAKPGAAVITYKRAP